MVVVVVVVDILLQEVPEVRVLVVLVVPLQMEVMRQALIRLVVVAVAVKERAAVQDLAELEVLAS
jgi:hypothetical protein